MFFSKLLLVFLATILGTSCGAWNGYPYPQSNGPSENSSPQSHKQWLPLYPSPESQDDHGYKRCVCSECIGGREYLYLQSNRGSRYPY
ncbi:hypothetical protein KQX54_017381 [Cotesia glomerata]|uniref:Secreted protein n=1 Tax=Cotesia glomerata TaxID=32391 RepID=A0AAV7I8X7_COTGL|nr:hypothetical protein KQX54_017381 [Cotesia glomerata]